MYSNAASQYKSIDLESRVEGASPHALVAMLYDGLLARIAQGKAAMQAGNFEQKGKNVTKALDILSALSGSLDPQHNPELAQNLGDLYDYCQRRLLDASAQRDASGFDEVRDLIGEIKEAWDAIASKAA